MRALPFALFALALAACVPPPPATAQSKKDSSSTGSSSSSGSSSTTACGPVTARGQCQSTSGTSTTVLKCVNNAVQKDDCSTRGLVCTVDATAGAMCTSSATKSSDTTTSGTKSGGTSSSGTTNGTQPCGSVPPDGVCSSNTLKWCFNNKLFTQDCTVDKGATCKTVGSKATCTTSTGATPTPTTPTKVACGAITPGGTCEGNTLKWCDQGNLVPIDCGVDHGWTCKASGDSATCVPPGSDGSDCGTITYEGECTTSTTLTYCLDGKKTVLNCGTDGGTCQTSAGNSDCAYTGGGSTTSGGCGSVPPTGICDGNIRTWCENNLLHTDPCDPSNSYCDYSAEGAVFCNYFTP